MDGKLKKKKKKINNGIINENLTKGLFSKLGTGLRKATRDDEALGTSSTGQLVPLQGQKQKAYGNPVRSTVMRKGHQTGIRAFGGGIYLLLPN